MLQTLKTLVRFRSLLGSLTARELAARYRGSALGFLWSLVNPLMLFGVYAVVFGVILEARGGSSTDPYPLFLITGLFPWIWTSASLLEGAVSLSANAGLIRKAVFPCEVLPTVVVCANLVHFLLALPILLIALGWGRFEGADVLGPATLLLPLVVVLHFVLLVGAAMGLAALNVHFKDVRDLLGNVLTLLFFLAPILYALADVPNEKLQTLVRFNPFTPFALGYQSLLFRGEPIGWELWVEMSGLALAALFLGTLIFRRLEDTLVESV